MNIQQSSNKSISWGGQSFVLTRSFRCNFCKRGFSNAQALGGHMNIHRKDRAKLIEFSEENLLTLDITRSIDSFHSDEEKRLGEGSGRKECLNEMNHEVVAGSAEETNTPNGSEKSKNLEGVETSKRMKVVGFNNGDLDLELRLGPHPKQFDFKASNSGHHL